MGRMMMLKPIPGLEHYSVDAKGGIWKNGRKHIPFTDRKGYKRITLAPKIDGKYKTFLAHRLVALAWFGPCPEGKQCAHLDGNPGNNRPDNLAYKTPKENNADKILHGTHQCGERNPLHKLTKEAVIYIRKSGDNVKMLAKKYNVDESTIRNARTGRLWNFINVEIKKCPRRSDARLSVENILEIRRSNLSSRELSEKFRTSMGHIREIILRKKWKHL